MRNDKKIEKSNIKLIFNPALAIIAFMYFPTIIYLLLLVFNMSNMLTNFISNLIYLLLIIIILRKSLKKDFIDYKNNFTSYFKIGARAWLIGVLIMIFSNLILNIFIFNGNISGNEQAVRKVLFEYPLLVMISSVFIAPIVEEITFRKILKDSINTKWLYIIFSGFVFGLLHSLTDISSILNFFYIIPYGALGSSFAYMNYKTNNIFTSITFHFLHNFITVVLLMSAYSMV